MASRFENLRPGVLVLALAISIFIWAVAQGTSSIQESFDVPVELVGIEEGLVVTDQNSDAINVRLRGSRASLRNLDREQMKYRVDASGGKPGVAVYEIDVETIEHPTGTTFAGYSPSRIQVRFEKRGRKAVSVRAEVEGVPAPGFHVAGVVIEPERVWLEGARSQVMRLNEVVTEAIDIAGLAANAKQEVRLVLGGGTVWAEDTSPLQVEVLIEADPLPEPVLNLDDPESAEERG
ncbi:MAG TPA: YbbR-like domain-containing protein [Myxococcales bacterium]|nr:YbbR-like domain-containing protein [Myxococcales bacterium]HIL80239.1 YbbR-like domain-containing protein [Myxococcales bacterium]